jgi:NAD(P)-dependent dehydrogenase (short-subunit alcohol dehydrogenase family)
VTSATESTVRRFDGAVAIVTGAANGIGRAIAEALLAEGASVCAVDLEDATALAGRGQVEVVRGDVADEALASRAVEAALDRFGRVDVLVNDAAAYPDATVLEMAPAEWRRVFEVNVTGPFLLSRAFARACIAGGRGGRIVNISTGSTRSPRPAGAAYAASKSALETLSRVLAMELGPHGIAVNVVAPGYVDVRGWSDREPDRASDELRAALVSAIPLGRAGDPRDIAAAVLFLCSDAAAHVSGAVLDVDGGSLAGRFELERA